jgi:hypothetical protein
MIMSFRTMNNSQRLRCKPERQPRRNEAAPLKARSLEEHHVTNTCALSLHEAQHGQMERIR